MIARLKDHIKKNSKVVFKDWTYRGISIVTLILYFYIPFLYRYEINDVVRQIFPDDKAASFWIPLIVNMASVVFPILVYSCIYNLNHPFFEQYKTSKDRWPWHIDEKRYKAKYLEAVKNIIINYGLIAGALQYVLVYYFGLVTSSRPEDLDDSYWKDMGKVLFMMFCDDFHTHWSHKLMHVEYFYSKYHSVHHRWSNTVVIATENTHPIEYILTDFSEIFLGEILLGGSNLIAFGTFTSFRNFEAAESHGGYEFPWSFTRMLPFSATSEYHEYHHRKGTGNFSNFWILWDTVFGDNHEYFRLKKE